MTITAPTPELCPLGVDGILVRFSKTLTEEANARALRFRDQVAEADITGKTEVASSLASVRIGFDPEKTTRATIAQAIQDLLLDQNPIAPEPKRIWHIPTAFGPDFAPQLAEAAALAGVSTEKAVSDIEAATLRVMAIGFAPGQPYLGMLPDNWDIPRQTALTEGPPRGALICAVRQLIIWAADAPTGWRHIGQTAFRVYLPETDTPFAFQPGDAVQFRAVSDDTFCTIQNDATSNGGAQCKVLR